MPPKVMMCISLIKKSFRGKNYKMNIFGWIYKV
jgi:hypothetical protein